MWVNGVAPTLAQAWQEGGAGLRHRLSLVFPQLEEQLGQLKAEWWPTVMAEAALLPDLGELAWQAAQTPMQTLLLRGGKRFRLLLCAAQAQAEGGQLGGAGGLVVELVHTASLIADDIEDASPLRRGQPTMHQICGIGPALNSSNWGYFFALLLLEAGAKAQCISAELECELYRCYHRSLRRLHLGQALDIYWHEAASPWPTSMDYLRMCRLKTGALLRLACELALLPLTTVVPPVPGGAARLPLSMQRLTQLADLWEDVGQIFQMIDDLQNVSCGNEGKLLGDDLLEGKKGWPLLCELERLQGLERESRQAWLTACMQEAQRAPTEWEPRWRVSQALRASGTLQHCHAQLEQLLHGLWIRLLQFYPQHQDGPYNQDGVAVLFDLLLLCFYSLERCRLLPAPVAAFSGVNT